MATRLGTPRFRLLGQVEVADASASALRGVKQRTLLAYLLLHANEIVPTERLVDAVWGDRAPPTATAVVHSYIRKLRDALADGPAELVTRAPGYVLELDDAELDVHVFEQLAGDGKAALRAEDYEAARVKLTSALSLWRGEPFADLPQEGFLATERARLLQLHLEATSDRIDADLAVGRASELIAELESLIREHPYQERLRLQLMLALYRSARQADALAVYRDTRRLLADQLGLVPSKELQRLEAAILRQDESLESPLADLKHEGEQPQRPPTRPRRSRRLLLAALVVAAVITAVGIAVALGGGSSPKPLTRTARILATFNLPQPSCCGFGNDAAWGVGHHDDILRKIDPRTGRVVGKWRVADYQSGVPLPIAGAVWIPSAAGDLVRFDPARQRVAARIHVQGPAVAFGYLTIWETTTQHQLDRINLLRNKVRRSIRLAPGANNWVDELAVGEGAVWVAVADDATLVRIDPLTNAIVGRISGFGTTDSGMPIAVDQNAVWVLRFVGGQQILFRVDPSSNEIAAKIPVGKPNGSSPAGTVATGGGFVWTGNWDATISKVDPKSNRVVAIYKLPAVPQNVNFGEGSLWVDSYDASKVWRIDPNA